LSVGFVTVGEWVVVVADPRAAAVVVVAPFTAVVVVVAPFAGAVVGTVVVVVVGSTKGVVSPLSEAWVAVGVAERFVQLRAASQLCMAVAAGVPVRGWGSPPRMVAGRKVDPRMWRPSTVMRSTPLSVSGAVSS
jgi:hypothetical protein